MIILLTLFKGNSILWHIFLSLERVETKFFVPAACWDRTRGQHFYKHGFVYEELKLSWNCLVGVLIAHELGPIF